MVEPMVQVNVECPNCGRGFEILKIKGIDTEGIICQRCEVGEVQLPE